MDGNPASRDNTKEDTQMLDFLVRKPAQKLRQDIFERDFLPFFDLRGMDKEVADKMLQDMRAASGDAYDFDEKHLVGNMMQRWIESVPSPYLPTEIVAADGTVMFTVPAIFRAPRDSLRIGGEEMFQLIETAGNMYNVHPAEGDRFIKQRILPNVILHAGSYDEIRQWNVIFDYYGFPRYTLPGEAESTKPNAVEEDSAVDDNDDDYELF
jgi:hypothetical protein